MNALLGRLTKILQRKKLDGNCTRNVMSYIEQILEADIQQKTVAVRPTYFTSLKIIPNKLNKICRVLLEKNKNELLSNVSPMGHFTWLCQCFAAPTRNLLTNSSVRNTGYSQEDLPEVTDTHTHTHTHTYIYIVCMCVYIYVYVCVHSCIYMFHMYMCVCIYIYIYIHVKCVFFYMYIYMYICGVYIYIYMYVCI